jgi:hypothetical protein
MINEETLENKEKFTAAFQRYFGEATHQAHAVNRLFLKVDKPEAVIIGEATLGIA